MVMSGRTVRYAVRRNHRAKRVWIKVDDHEGLVLVLPRWGSEAFASQYLRRHQDWVLRQLEQRDERVANAPPPLGSSRTVVYRGRPLPLKFRNCACAAPSVEWHRDHLLVQVPWNSEQPLADLLTASFKDRARDIFQRRVQSLSELLGVKPKRISVRDQKTRWGACTGRGTITFNWRLVLAPPPVLDYVVVHELCHLRHPNHGPRFWEMVGTACPNYETHRIWLRENGSRLRA